MNKRDFYETPKSGRVMRLLWKAAGGDRYLLERATYSDQIKYMCLGGIVFATGAMAGLAGGYAFYTIFAPRGNALDNMREKLASLSADVVSQTLEKTQNTAAIQATNDAISSFQTQQILIPIISIVFGIIWGLMIFNIDRFIVTSTGKGDGTEAITWKELKGAIPRILMGMIIAITISKPVEIRMFKTEIDNRLYDEQLKLQKDFEDKTTANFEGRIKVVEDDLGKIGEQRNDLNNRIKKAEEEYTNQLQGRAGAPAGDGKLSKALKSTLDALNNELDKFDLKNAVKLEEADKRRKELLLEKDIALAKNKDVANNLDGLLERIKLAHEAAGWAISLFITLLFMAIELTPIFFKLMLTKTPYDYLAENRDDLILAEKGIEIQYDYYKDKKDLERHLIINHEAERLLYEKMATTNIQKELTDYAMEKYKEREKKKIDDNLDNFIDLQNPAEDE